jgi:DNA-directed RNA polymerase-3 subunit RPC5
VAATVWLAVLALVLFRLGVGGRRPRLMRMRAWIGQKLSGRIKYFERKRSVDSIPSTRRFSTWLVSFKAVSHVNPHKLTHFLTLSLEDLHLTPVSSLVHLRPQLHHIDATVQQERQAAATKDSAPTTAGGTARAIHMTVKATGDGETVTTETMADRLRSVQTEHWRTMHYTDENEEAAWEVYNESLFLRPAEEEGAEGDKKADDAEEVEPVLEESVPKFARRWDDDDLLEAVSGIKKPVPAPAPEPVKKTELKPVAPPKQPEQPAPESEEARKPKLRPRGGAAGGVARRGGKPRAAAPKTVNIDE